MSTSKTEVEVIVFVAIMLHKVNHVLLRRNFQMNVFPSLTKQVPQ